MPDKKKSSVLIVITDENISEIFSLLFLLTETSWVAERLKP